MSLKNDDLLDIEQMPDTGHWFKTTCTCCGLEVEARWTNLRAVARTGNENLGVKEYRPVPA